MCRWFTARNNATADVELIILVFPVVLSDRLVDRVRMCEIRGEIYGASDHCPIVLEVAPPIAS